MAATRRRLGPAAVMALVTAIGTAGCGKPRPVSVATADPCFPPEPGDEVAADTVVLAMPTAGAPDDDHGLVDPASRFLVSATHRPLVWIDCHGRAVAALAASWRRDDAGGAWTFSLAAGPDGAEVRDRWRDAAGGRAWPWPGIAEVTVLGARILRVQLVIPRPELPVEFADRRLAVPSPALGPVIRVVPILPAADQRNLLDPGQTPRIDLLFSRDPTTIDYARSRAEWRVVPLPWDRLYLLVTAAPLPKDPAVGAATIESVRGDARVPVGPPWWSARPDCDLRPEPRPGAPRPEVAFLAGDPVARDLAERMVAVGVPPSPIRLRAVSLDSARLAAVLEDGGVAGVIVADPVQPPLGCSGRPWSTRAPFRYPLLETRAHLIVRRGVGPLTIDRDGTVRFRQPGQP